MRKLLAYIFVQVLSVFSLAQVPTSLAELCRSAVTAAQNNDFTTAKQNYDAAISIVAKQPNSDLVLNVPEELSEYIIVSQAKTNPEEAQECAMTLLELQMHCLSYCANKGYFHRLISTTMQGKHGYRPAIWRKSRVWKNRQKAEDNFWLC